MMAKSDNFPYDIFDFLIKPIRDADLDGVLEDYLGGPQQAFEQIVSNIDDLVKLFNVDRVDEAYLDYLKWIVGWTKETDNITLQLTNSEKRKLIRLSAGLWKLKGTEIGVKTAFRALTGRDVIFHSWFHFRWELGIAGIWRNGLDADPWLVGNTNGDLDEYVSFIFVMDELGTNRQLMRDVAQINRPIGEVYYLVYADLVDDFSIGRGKWKLVSGSDFTWDETENNISLPDGTCIQANVEQTWDGLEWFQTVTLADPGQQFNLHMRSSNNGDEKYKIEFIQTGMVNLVRTVAGLDTVVSSHTLPDMLPIGEAFGVGYRITHPTAAELKIQVRYGADIIIDHTFSVAFVHAVGGNYCIENIGAGTLVVDNVLAYTLPVYVDFITQTSSMKKPVSPSIPAPTVVQNWTMNSTLGWTLTGLWHATGYRYHTPFTSLYFGQGETGHNSNGTVGNYAGAIYAGSALTPTLDFTAYAGYKLWVQFRNDPRVSILSGQDSMKLELLAGGAVVRTFTKAQLVTATSPLRFEIPEAVGEALVQLCWSMDTIVNHGSTDEGWYLDDIYILATRA